MGNAGGSPRTERRLKLGLFALVFGVVLLAPASALAVVRSIAPPPTGATAAPARSIGLPAPSGLSVTAGNMVDTLRWAPVRSTLTYGYRIERASSPGGPWKLVTARTTSTSRAARVWTARTWYYRVRTVSRSGVIGAPCAAVANDALSLTAVVGSRGAILRASNGALSLSLPRGTFTRSTRVAVRPVVAPGAASLIRVTPAYDFYASTALRLPAKVTLRYRVPVEHFQVANTVARGIDWMTCDPTTGRWTPVTTTVNTVAGTLTATMPHFSWWTGAYTQPHGTTPTKTDYCGTVCHSLAISPLDGDAISIQDSEVCYHCHGNASAAAVDAVAANGHNIQGEFFACSGQSLPAGGSMHPVRLPGSPAGLKCTSCHDPHADPVKSPKLLRAFDAVTGRAIASAGGTTPGTAYCWACHGSRKNAAVAAAVPGYWTRTGDKRTTFNGAHTALGAADWRFDSEEELKRGYASSAEIRADGTVAIAGTVMLPKTPTPPVTATPTPNYYGYPGAPWAAYDGKLATIFQWFAKDIGAPGVSPSNPKVGSASLTIDLGTATSVQAFECYFDTSVSGGAFNTDVLEILTSDDDATWRTVATQGTIGTRSGDRVYITMAVPDTCRYVRFVFSRVFSESEWHSICPAEVGIYGPPAQGTYEVWPDIARKAAFSGGVVKWTSTEPASTSISVSVRASTNKGSTWTTWQPVTNGGPITQIPVGASLENARLQVRSTLNGVGTSPLLDSLEVSIDRGAIVGAAPQWSGASPVNQCQRCHTSHSSTSAGLVADGSTAACKTCHSAAYGGSYVGSAQFAGSKHAAVPCADCHTAHGAADSGVLTYAFLLRDDRAEACLACHTTVKAGFDAKTGEASEWAKHDIRSAEQVKTGSTLTCRNCHGTHFSSTGLVDPDSIATPFTAMRDDPTSIPTGEVVIYATKDTMLDSTAGQETWNYGKSTEVAVTPSKRALLYFDLSSIPAGATIQNAELVLWGSLSGTYTGAFLLYPALRGWNEGSGLGEPNSALIDGATWLQWSFGNDWTAPGGDYGAVASTARSGINAVDVTSLVTALRTGTNHGIVVGPSTGSTSLPFYTRESGTAQYRPKLRIVYRTGPATRQVVDDITFCAKCHDGAMPLGLSGQSVQSIGNRYMTTAVHGGEKGLGPESRIFPGFMPAERGGGYLKAPYSYGMDALPCTTCHDPHGSRLPYHLKETVNGRDMGPLLASGWNGESISGGPGAGYFCAACHVFPTDHAGFETAGGHCFNSCHSH